VIRFSASLVAIAIGLLVAGLVTSDLKLVYAAIGVSSVALLALIAGAAIKREDLFGEDGQSSAQSFGSPSAFDLEQTAAERATSLAPAASSAPAAAPAPAAASFSAATSFPAAASGPVAATASGTTSAGSGTTGAGWGESNRWASPNAGRTSSASPWPAAPGADTPVTAAAAPAVEVSAPASGDVHPVDAGWTSTRDRWDAEPAAEPWDTAAETAALPEAGRFETVLAEYTVASQLSGYAPPAEPGTAEQPELAVADTAVQPAAEQAPAVDGHQDDEPAADGTIAMPVLADEPEDSAAEDSAAEDSAAADSVIEGIAPDDRDPEDAGAGDTVPEDSGLVETDAGDEVKAADDVEVAGGADSEEDTDLTTDTDLAADAGRPADTGPATDTATASGPDAAEAASPAAEDGSASDADATREVTVVPGVPRFHNAQCILIRFMGDDDLERMPLSAAQEAGCTPCRACLPD
jgi:hypothetical protein